MPNENPMFHMDTEYNWRWYITNPFGNPVSMSARSFFNYEDAKRDYEMARQLLTQAA